ncbi:MAG: hypothetical protein P4L44_15555 [Oryzomonas sp.]|uniref:hypothetical protein n=1 Tax=Oryzomonas sp. TaxID=2855186 RepID=UPI00284DBA28|nr:hypothetical protein [Oryzomonas sp.]MDR3581376.1 hypothetical protein [Oryzomonas sp.]
MPIEIPPDIRVDFLPDSFHPETPDENLIADNAPVMFELYNLMTDGPKDRYLC